MNKWVEYALLIAAGIIAARVVHKMFPMTTTTSAAATS